MSDVFNETLKQLENLLEEGRLHKANVTILEKSKAVLKNENKRLIEVLDKKSAELREVREFYITHVNSLILTISKRENEIGKLREIEEERDSLRQVNKQLTEQVHEMAQNLADSKFYGEEKDVIITELALNNVNLKNDNKQLKEDNLHLQKSINEIVEATDYGRS